MPRLDLVDEQLDEAQIVRARQAPLALLVQQEQRLEHRVRVALHEVLSRRLVAGRRAHVWQEAEGPAQVIRVRHRHLCVQRT